MSDEHAAEPAASQRYRFVVGSAEEAAKVIREKLGASARVTSVRQVEGEGLSRFLKSPRLEVIAEMPAVSAGEPHKPAEAEGPVSVGANQHTTQAREISPSDVAEPQFHAISEQTGKWPEKKLWTVLERAGLRRDVIARFQNQPSWRALEAMALPAALARASLLLRDAAHQAPEGLRGRTVFFGSPGAGTSTALCKQLAHDVFLRGSVPCVMKLDGEQPNSTEGLAMYCEALGVPLLRSVRELDEQTPDVRVYFDVPGTRLQSAEAVRLSRLFGDLAIQSRVLVVNAAYESELIKAAYTHAAGIGGTHVVFTHFDEIPRFGKLWEFVFDSTLVPLFASTGQDIASDRVAEVVDFLVRRTLGALHD